MGTGTRGVNGEFRRIKLLLVKELQGDKFCYCGRRG